jgi:hypothetical protein
MGYVKFEGRRLTGHVLIYFPLPSSLWLKRGESRREGSNNLDL